MFNRYPSIENSYREKFVNAIRDLGIDNETWVAHEKIHGANFSIWYDGTEVKFGKRSGLIGDGADFFKFQKLIPELTELAHKIWASCELKEGQVLTIYGELFGGCYPHPDVERVEGVSKVQDTVFYSPDIQFRYFDIAIDGHFMPPSCWPDSTQKHQVVPVALFDHLDDALQCDVEQSTLTPCAFGLPSIDGNIAEGVVIRPFKTEISTRYGERVILKKKSSKFSERNTEPRIKQPTEKMSPEVQAVFDQLAQYINTPRLESVCSKLGPVTLKDFKTVREHLFRDAVEAFNLDNGSAALGTLSKEDARTVHKAVGALTASATRDFLMAKG